MRERLHHATRIGGPPLGLGLLLALIGPFGTFDALPLAVRIPYWVSVVAVNWLLCDLAVRRLHALLPQTMPLRHLATPLSGGFLAALPATGVVHTAGVIAGLEVSGLPSLFGKVLLLCAALSLVFYLNAPDDESAPAVGRENGDEGDDEPATGTPDTTTTPANPGHLFFQRLEAPLHGRLLCLEMQDHYMIVHSTGGRQMILCRMADATRELDGLGRRVHRSWWVADAAVTGRRREQGRLLLTLVDGRQVPVGRTYQDAVLNVPGGASPTAPDA